MDDSVGGDSVDGDAAPSDAVPGSAMHGAMRDGAVAAALDVVDLSSCVPGVDPLVVLAARSPHRPGSAERRSHGRALLREAAVRLGSAAEDVVVAAHCPECGGDHGRPVVTDARTGLRRFGSVTHAGMTTLVALGPAAVGIDAETIADDTARDEAIREVTGRTRDEAPDGIGALRVWTAIEAVLKADGRGLTVDPRTVRLHDCTGTSGARATIAGDRGVAVSGFVTDGLVVTIAW